MTQTDYKAVRARLRELSNQLQGIHRLLAESERNEPAESRFAEARGYTAPLSGEWRCSGDIICCGTLRIAVLDIDTQPSDEFKAKLGAWMCRTMNEAQYAELCHRSEPVATSKTQQG